MMAAARLLVALTAIAASAAAAHFPRDLNARAVVQGWSLQSTTCPQDTTSCGSGACCPSGTYCQATGNGEVPACCLSSKCRRVKPWINGMMGIRLERRPRSDIRCFQQAIAEGLLREIQFAQTRHGLYGRGATVTVSAV